LWLRGVKGQARRVRGGYLRVRALVSLIQLLPRARKIVLITVNRLIENFDSLESLIVATCEVVSELGRDEQEKLRYEEARFDGVAADLKPVVPINEAF